MDYRSRRFIDDRGGNFAMLTAIVIFPLLLGVGLALDVSNIARKHSELQQSVDAAVLAITREGEKISDQRARQIAEQFLGANFDLKVDGLQITRNEARVQLDVQSSTDLAFGGLFGKQTWPIQAAASADIAYADYEIGLVLDTTGSMADGKLKSMKEAVIGLIDGMSKQVDDKKKLKFALVPFATFVNVGSQYGPKFDKKTGKQIAGDGAAWLDLTGKAEFPQVELAPDASRFQLYQNLGQSWSGCVETRNAAGKGYDVNDAAPNVSKPETLFVPAFAIDEPDSGGFRNSYISSSAKPKEKSVAEKRNRFAKYGVATDETTGKPKNNGMIDPLNKLVKDVVGGLLNLIEIALGKPAKIDIDTKDGKGPNKGCDGIKPITPLTSDYADLKKKVNEFEAAGTTNITEGVAWGMRVLSPAEPFTQGRDDKTVPNLDKILIVLTDGTNNLGPKNNGLGSDYSSEGYLVDGRLGISVGGSSETNGKMNEKTLATCKNAKDDGIEVYTIRLEEPDVATGMMLRECASSPGNFFDVPTRAKLDEAFGKIRERIVKIRIAS
jgi:Flp pilus assembly protein TadG